MNKVLIVILLSLLFNLQTRAQEPGTNLGTPGRAVKVLGRLYVKEIFYPPFRATHAPTSTLKQPGAFEMLDVGGVAQPYYWDGSTWHQIFHDGNFSGNLASLADVHLGTLQVNDVLQWNGTEWINAQVGTGGVVESDPIYSASPAATINSTSISNWNTAYSWGNHATAGYLTAETDPLSLRLTGTQTVTGGVKTFGTGTTLQMQAGSNFGFYSDGATAAVFEVAGYKWQSNGFNIIWTDKNGTGTGFTTTFGPQGDPTGNRTIVLPDKSGTVALTSDLPSGYVTTESDPTVNNIIKNIPVSADATTNKYLGWNGSGWVRKQVAYADITGAVPLPVIGAGQIGYGASGTGQLTSESGLTYTNGNLTLGNGSFYGVLYDLRTLGTGPGIGAGGILAGHGAIWGKTDGKLYYTNDAGTVYDLTAPSGITSEADPIYTANGVDKTTTQTIAGAKTFSAGIAAHGGLYWRTPGQAGTNLQGQLGSTTNGTNYWGTLTLGNDINAFKAMVRTPTLTADRTYLLPDAGGTLALQEWVQSQGYLTSVSTPSLSQVLAVGNTSSTSLSITSGASYVNLQGSSINVTDGGINSAYIAPNVMWVTDGSNGINIRNDHIKFVGNGNNDATRLYANMPATGTNNIYLPNASGTIALTSDIPAAVTPTLQQVTEVGATTTLGITANNFTTTNGRVAINQGGTGGAGEISLISGTGVTKMKLSAASGFNLMDGTEGAGRILQSDAAGKGTWVVPPYLTSYTETDPLYTANGVPKTRTLTINGTALDLSANRSWTITESDPIWTSASTNYYTKTNLQTSGQAAVHWGNVTNAPAFLTAETDPSALKITGNQTAAGNKLFSNSANVPSAGWITYNLAQAADNGSDNGIAMLNASETAATRAVLIGERSRGTLTTPTTVTNGDWLFGLVAAGFDATPGTALRQTPAAVEFKVDGVPGAGTVPASIELATGTNGANRTSRVTIGSNGTVTFPLLAGTGQRVATISSTGAIGSIANTTDGYILTLSGGVPVWAANGGASGSMTNPMTTLGDIIYGGAAGSATRLPGAAGFLKSTGAAAPTWSAVTKSDVGLANVENTALSTWAGSSNITTIGTITSGTVPIANTSGTVPVNRGGTGLTALGTGLQLLRVNSGGTALEYFTPAYLTSYTETDPVWTSASANYYTKTNLQTSGQAAVHWGNVTNAPAFLTAETDPGVLTKVLTGYVVGANTALAATDNVLGAFQKLQGQLNNKQASGSYLTSESDPLYTANGVPKTRTLTINGTALDLSLDRSWTITTASNLALGTATASTLPITNSNGTGYTLPTFSTTAGLVPGTTSSTTNFLRADGTWAAPPGNGTVSSGTAGRMAIYNVTGTTVVNSNANLIWDDTNSELRLGNMADAGAFALQVAGSQYIGGSLNVGTSTNPAGYQLNALGDIYSSTAIRSGQAVYASSAYRFGAADDALSPNGTTLQIGGVAYTTVSVLNAGLKVAKLATGLTAPTTTGTTKMVVTDANGQLSFQDIPTTAGGGSVFYLENTLYSDYDTLTRWNPDGAQWKAIKVTGGTGGITVNKTITDTTILYTINSSAGTTLAGLTDVAITTPATGNVLSYNGTTSKWNNLAAATMVLTSPVDGQILEYDQPTNTWINVNKPTGGTTNIGLGTATASTLPLTSSSGTGATLPVFSTTAGLVPGVASATGKVLSDNGTWVAQSGGTTYTFNSSSIVNTAGNLALSGDAASPGNYYVYGTNGSGTKGFQAGTNMNMTGFVAGDLVQYTGSNTFGRLDGTTVALKTDNVAGSLLAVKYLTTGTSYTPTAGTTKIVIEMVGGGGGGGGVTGAASSGSAGGGGGAGAYLVKYLTGVTGAPFTYAIGAAGSAGANTGGTGGTGGNTTITIGGVTYTAAGGAGGVGMTSGTAVAMSGGGAAGTATNGDINTAGDPGLTGIRLSATVVQGGNGGSTRYGGGGKGTINATAAGAAGTGYGAGGSGATAASNASNVGGLGTQGIIIVYEYK